MREHPGRPQPALFRGASPALGHIPQPVARDCAAQQLDAYCNAHSSGRGCQPPLLLDTGRRSLPLERTHGASPRRQEASPRTCRLNSASIMQSILKRRHEPLPASASFRSTTSRCRRGVSRDRWVDRMGSPTQGAALRRRYTEAQHRSALPTLSEAAPTAATAGAGRWKPGNANGKHGAIV